MQQLEIGIIVTIKYITMNYYQRQTKSHKQIREAILRKGYYKDNENSIEELFQRVSKAFSTDAAHEERIYDYLCSGWFVPATPILSNAGSKKNMPISCFLNEAEDTLKDIIDTRVESEYLTSYGGGIGTNFSNIREVGSVINDKGKTAGVIPIVLSNYKSVDAIMQAGTRRGAIAAYLHVSHPEIEEFLYLRKKGGDYHRKALSTPSAHHGIIISDDFMHAVRDDKKWYFKSPHTGKKTKFGIKARELWQEILITRVETGEPYLLFEDNVNKAIPDSYKELGLKVKMSNLCSEITLATGKDHLGNKRTAVCCLSSLNLYTYDEWKNNSQFIQDVLEFLDNVLQHFIDNAPDTVSCAKYSAMRERSIGLGVMGFHSYLQKHLIDIESEEAKKVNKIIFANIYQRGIEASCAVAGRKGVCPDIEEGSNKCLRFSHIFAIAPTATIGKIAGQVSKGIEPFYSAVYLDKAKEGKNTIINPVFQELLDSKDMTNQEEIIESVIKADGNLSVVNMNHGYIFTAEEVKAFKPWKMIDQKKLIKLAADRQNYICQSQSLDILVDPKISKEELHEIHWLAWKLGCKSMYYCRSFSVRDFGNKQECEVCQ
jgi:ribonucleoside-diphosphate reductase alpha chain